MADYDVEVELVDGHTMTVRVEDAESSFIAATRAGDLIVRLARAKLTGTQPCPKCRDSGIELVGAFLVRVPDPPSGGVVRRVICECAHGRALLERHGDGGRRYPEVQHHLDEPEAEVRPRTDGTRGWEGETYCVSGVEPGDPCPCGGSHAAGAHDVAMAAETGGER